MACTQHLAWPPQTQIHLGYFKAIAGAHQHLQPLAGQHVAAGVDQKAVGGGSSPPHSTPQLVQLGKTEAFSMLNHHHTGLRHINTNLHHRGAYKHLGLPAGEGADGGLFLSAA